MELSNSEMNRKMLLELKDGTRFEGCSFGAKRSTAGELVFQTGMVGYPESLTDPSYRGQILVITFPLIGNYGVPSRTQRDELIEDIPAFFESAKIHVAGLVVASYCGEDYSHHLAESSLGTWLCEQNVPAMHSVDTRAITKLIREEGSMLGRMMIGKPVARSESSDWQEVIESDGNTPSNSSLDSTYQSADWHDPNIQNLVADGENVLRPVLPRVEL